jgi:hypothetical protein
MRIVILSLTLAASTLALAQAGNITQVSPNHQTATEKQDRRSEQTMGKTATSGDMAAGNQQSQGIEGVIGDAKCGRVHSVYPGLGAAGCARACVQDGSHYILVTKDGRVLPLTGNKDVLANFAGESVRVTSTNVQNAQQIQPISTPGEYVPVSEPQ